MKIPTTLKWAAGAVVCLGALGAFVAGQMKTAACGFPADAARGRVFADTCKGCHDISPRPQGLMSAGPNLQFVYGSLPGTRPRPGGRRNASLAAAADAGVVWTDENLVHYLKGPKAFLIHATGKTFPDVAYMPYDIASEPSRRDVVAYLKFIKTRPDCD